MSPRLLCLISLNHFFFLFDAAARMCTCLFPRIILESTEIGKFLKRTDFPSFMPSDELTDEIDLLTY